MIKFKKPFEFVIDEKTGCFNCQQPSPGMYGYPVIKVKERTTNLHRYIYEQCFGDIPKEIVIRHKCDNRSCINPEHLEPGTRQENMVDKMERGRQSFGEENGSSKLTEKQVVEIRKQLNKGEKLTHLGRRFNVTHSAIAKIRDRKTWRRV